MGVNCDTLINNKFSFEQIEIFLQKAISFKEISSEDKSISIQYNLLEEYNKLKLKSKLKQDILQFSKKYKIISGFIPLTKKREIFTKWIKILLNFDNISDFKRQKKQRIQNNKIFQKNLENAYLKDKKSFLKLVSQGLPDQLRQFIWTIIIDNDEKDILNVSNNEKEKIHLKTLISLKKNPKDIEQIEKDIFRTFLEEDKTEKNISKLRELLLALNNLNEKLGYVQGINFIVAFILKVTNFNKIKAFHLSRLILKKIKDYFTKDFPLLNYNLMKFNKGFTTLFPKLYCHFRDNDVIDELWIGKWIQTLFIVNLPFKEACYIWDSLLVYGFDFIIPISLSILHFTEKNLLKLNDSSDILSFFKETLNPSLNSMAKKAYKSDTDINQYVIPIKEIISCAKKIRNQLNLGPGDGNEYTLRNLLDKRKSLNRLLTNNSFFNYEDKMEKISAEKNEENNSIGLNSQKSFPSQSSTEDLSSFNNKNSNEIKNNNNHIYINNINCNNNSKRINKFFTMHHKGNIKDENKNYSEEKENKKNRFFSHKDDNRNNNYNSIFNSLSNKTPNIKFPFGSQVNRLNSRNSGKEDNLIKRKYSNQLLYSGNNINKNNRTFSENKNILNNFNIKDEQKINLTNMNIQTRNSYSYNNNMHQTMNNFNYYNNNSFNNSNNSYNLNYTFYNTYGLKYNSYINNNYDVNYNSNTSNYNPSPYLTVNYDRKHIYTPEVDKIRVKEKLNNNYYSFCYQNYTDDDIFMKGVNEFCEGEKYKKEIPQFNNIKSFNGY